MVSPASVNTRVMPRLRPTKPIAISKFLYRAGATIGARPYDHSKGGVHPREKRATTNRHAMLEWSWIFSGSTRPDPTSPDAARAARLGFGPGRKGRAVYTRGLVDTTPDGVVGEKSPAALFPERSLASGRRQKAGFLPAYRVATPEPALLHAVAAGFETGR